MPVVHDLTNEEYHALPSVSKSGLDLIARAPALYKYRRENPSPPTPAMRIGSLTHTAILEPDKLPGLVVVAPEVDRRTKEGKAKWAEFTEANEGKEIVTAQEHAKLFGMRDAVWKHPASAKLLSRVKLIETSIFESLNGVDVRIRPDAIRDDGIFVDLKTTGDASPRGFAKSVANYRYHVQDSFYSDVAQLSMGKLPPFVFLCVETESPYLVSVYTLTSDAKAIGRKLYTQDLATFRECSEADNWPGYSDEIQPLELPRWAMMSHEEQ